MQLSTTTANIKQNASAWMRSCYIFLISNLEKYFKNCIDKHKSVMYNNACL